MSLLVLRRLAAPVLMCLDAGALIAFIFPALVALKALKGRDPVVMASQASCVAGLVSAGPCRLDLVCRCHDTLLPHPNVPQPPCMLLLQGYWQWNAWALIVLGVLQAVAGVAAVLFFSDKGHNASGSGLMAYLF